MFQTRIFSFCVLPDGHQIHVFVGSVDALDGLAGSDIGEEVQSFPEGDVERSESLADGSLEGSFQSVLVLPDGLDAFVGDEVALLGLSLGVDLVVFEVDGHLQGGEDVFYASGNLGADSVAGEEDDLVARGGGEEGFVEKVGEAQHGWMLIIDLTIPDVKN